MLARFINLCNEAFLKSQLYQVFCHAPHTLLVLYDQYVISYQYHAMNIVCLHQNMSISELLVSWHRIQRTRLFF